MLSSFHSLLKTCFSLSNVTFIQSFANSLTNIIWYTGVQYFHFQEPAAVHNRNPFITQYYFSSLSVTDSSPTTFSLPFTMSLFTIINHFLLSSHLLLPFPVSSFARAVSHHISSLLPLHLEMVSYLIFPSLSPLGRSMGSRIIGKFRMLDLLLPVEENTKLEQENLKVMLLLQIIVTVFDPVRIFQILLQCPLKNASSILCEC